MFRMYSVTMKIVIPQKRFQMNEVDTFQIFFFGGGVGVQSVVVVLMKYSQLKKKAPFLSQ